MRTSVARLNMGASLAFTQPVLPPTPTLMYHLPFFFISFSKHDKREIINYFCLKDVAVLRVWCLKSDLIWGVKGSTWRTKPAVLKRGIQH